MRKKLLLLAATALLGNSVAVSNAAAKPSFADLTWYSSKSDVKKKMIERGYIFQQESISNGATDGMYSGKLLGLKVNVRNWFNSKNQLVKTTVVFQKGSSLGLYSIWRNVKDSIDSKYGQGINLTDVDDGLLAYDSLTRSQLNSGKKISSGWIFETYKYIISLDVEQIYVNDNEYYVVLSYESPNWGSELDRRNSKNDF